MGETSVYDFETISDSEDISLVDCDSEDNVISDKDSGVVEIEKVNDFDEAPAKKRMRKIHTHKSVLAKELVERGDAH